MSRVLAASAFMAKTCSSGCHDPQPGMVDSGACQGRLSRRYIASCSFSHHGAGRDPAATWRASSRTMPCARTWHRRRASPGGVVGQGHRRAADDEHIRNHTSAGKALAEGGESLLQLGPAKQDIAGAALRGFRVQMADRYAPCLRKAARCQTSASARCTFSSRDGRSAMIIGRWRAGVRGWRAKTGGGAVRVAGHGQRASAGTAAGRARRGGRPAPGHRTGRPSRTGRPRSTRRRRVTAPTQRSHWPPRARTTPSRRACGTGWPRWTAR